MTPLFPRPACGVVFPRRASRVVRETVPRSAINTSGLRPDQIVGAQWLSERTSALLADEMGLGKTAQALRALPERARGIVVCPASVQMVWREEGERWRPDLRLVDFEPRTPREREVMVVSYDSLPARDPRTTYLIRDDLSCAHLIFDEAHRVRNRSAERTRRARALAWQCGYVWGLTGTPMTGTPDDLWGLLVTLRLARAAFPGGVEEYGELCGRVARTIRVRGGGIRSVVKWDEIGEEVPSRLSVVMLRRRASDVIDLPPVQWIDVVSEAPADLRDHLSKITRAWDRYSPTDLPPFELFSSATAALARSRRTHAREIAEELSRERPTLAFSAHLDPLHEIARAPGALMITGAETDAERRMAVRAFTSGACRLLAISYDAGGEGLNLQTAGAVLLVDQPYLPSQIDQAVSRALRPNQKHDRLIVKRMVSDHVLDRRLLAIIDEKRRMIGEALGETAERRACQ